MLPNEFSFISKLVLGDDRIDDVAFYSWIAPDRICLILEKYTSGNLYSSSWQILLKNISLFLRYFYWKCYLNFLNFYKVHPFVSTKMSQHGGRDYVTKIQVLSLRSDQTVCSLFSPSRIALEKGLSDLRGHRDCFGVYCMSQIEEPRNIVIISSKSIIKRHISKYWHNLLRMGRKRRPSSIESVYFRAAASLGPDVSAIALYSFQAPAVYILKRHHHRLSHFLLLRSGMHPFVSERYRTPSGSILGPRSTIIR